MSGNTHFFDYLDLKQQDFSQTRLIVFSGQSGAGKSSYLEYLANNNESLKSCAIKTHNERPMAWSKIKSKKQTLIIDEVKNPFELYYIIRLLISGNTLLVANHAPTFLYKLIGLLTTARLFNIDRQTKKINHYLKSHGYQFSQATVETFCKTFGSSYLKLEIILETGDKPDFDDIYRKFIQFNKIHVQNNKY